jgi:hypothetical protein
VLSQDHVVRLAAHVAGIVVLRLAGGDFHLPKKPQQRIRPERDSHGKRPAFFEVLLPVYVAVITRRNIQSQGIVVMHHDAKAADVGPTFVPGHS